MIRALFPRYEVGDTMTFKFDYDSEEVKPHTGRVMRIPVEDTWSGSQRYCFLQVAGWGYDRYDEYDVFNPEEIILQR